MDTPTTSAVTGAFSFTGSYIADKLLSIGEKIRTLTNHPDPSHHNYTNVDIFPYNFDKYEQLVASLQGVDTLFNTYWMRFPFKNDNYFQAIKNSKTLFTASKDAGVKKIVHLSVTNPSVDSPYPYFRGKALVEKLLKDKRLNILYTIVRPAWLFELEDIPLNNIAWILRHLPIFGIFKAGTYNIQPVSQQDLASLIVKFRYRPNIQDSTKSKTLDVVGPETYNFIDMVRVINQALGAKTVILPFHGILQWIPFIMSKFMGILLRDVLLSKDEVESMSDNLLTSTSQPLGTTSFKAWLDQNAKYLGRHWVRQFNNKIYSNTHATKEKL